jgi:ABC-type maltose transport system permease subunit
MDRRIRQLAEQLDAHQISRREFLRATAAITGAGTVGLGVMTRIYLQEYMVEGLTAGSVKG